MRPSSRATSSDSEPLALEVVIERKLGRTVGWATGEEGCVVGLGVDSLGSGEGERYM